MAASAIDYRAGALACGEEHAQEAHAIARRAGAARGPSGGRSSASASCAVGRDDAELAAERLRARRARSRAPSAGPRPRRCRSTRSAWRSWTAGDLAGAEELLAESDGAAALGGRAEESIPSPLNIAEMPPGRRLRRRLRIVFEETLQPFLEISLRAGDRLRARQPGHDRPPARAARARRAAARRGRRALRAHRRRARSGGGARPPRPISSSRVGSPHAARARPSTRRWRCDEDRRPPRRRDGAARARPLVGISSGELRPRRAAAAGGATSCSGAAGDRWGLVSALWRAADLALARGRLEEAADAPGGSARGRSTRPNGGDWIAVDDRDAGGGRAACAAKQARAGALFEQARERYRRRNGARGARSAQSDAGDGEDGRCKASPRTVQSRAKRPPVGMRRQRRPENGGRHERDTSHPPSERRPCRSCARRSTARCCAPATTDTPRRARVWNGAFDERRPAVIVRCSGAADVIAAVGFARSNDLPSRCAAAATASPASRPATTGS